MKHKLSLNCKTKVIILVLISFAMFGAFLYLFNAQLTHDDGRYNSDILLHLGIALRGKGYSILYKIIALLYTATGTTFSIALLESFIVVGTWFVAAKFIDVLYEKKDFFSSAMISFPVMFLSGIYIPMIYGHFYSGQLVTQPYHNITYNGMRLVAVIAMPFFIKAFESYRDKIQWKSLVIFSILLVLSTLIKPSFLYGLALALLCFLVYDFIKLKFNPALFGRMVAIGCTVLPSVVIMYFQANMLYAKSVNEGGTSIAIVWGMYFVKKGVINTLFKLLCSLFFPTMVFLVNRKNLKRTEMFIYVMYGIQLFITIMFKEVGARGSHGNFAWGLYGAAFFLFLVTASRFVDNLKHRKDFGKLYIISGSVLAGAHILSGLAYFAAIMLGAGYSL